MQNLDLHIPAHVASLLQFLSNKYSGQEKKVKIMISH